MSAWSYSLVMHNRFNLSSLPDAIVTLNQSQYEFTEGQPPFLVCIEVVDDVSIEAQLALNIRTETGTAGTSDFEALDQQVFVNGSTCFEVMIVADELLEEEEVFTLLTGSGDTRLSTMVSEAEIHIIDSNSKRSIWLQLNYIAKQESCSLYYTLAPAELRSKAGVL